MYTIDEFDRVVEIEGAPRSDGGAPSPIVLASDTQLLVAYHLADFDRHADGAPQLSADGERIALARFRGPCAHMFGPPNDEAFDGHPLVARGLRCFNGMFKVEASSWIRALAKMNSVHSRHDDASYARLGHFILPFKDQTFECVAASYAFEFYRGRLREVVGRIVATEPL